MKVGQKGFYRKLNLDTRRKRPSFQLDSDFIGGR